MGLWVSMFIYPMVGGWVWGGWLQNLGRITGCRAVSGGLRRLRRRCT
ncbi:MAG: hypothetical protein R2851_29140 [Caldilineaceae bacterium]